MLDNEVIKSKIAELSHRVVIETKWPPCSDEQLDAAEAELGLKLPRDYRRFLQNINGAIIYDSEGKNVVYCDLGRDDEDDVLVDLLYGIRDKEDTYDLRPSQRSYFFDEWIGAPWLNIGESASDQICLDTDSGAVAAHEIHTASPSDPDGTEHPPGFDARTEMVPLASSFSEFFKKLRAKEYW